MNQQHDRMLRKLRRIRDDQLMCNLQGILQLGVLKVVNRSYDLVEPHLRRLVRGHFPSIDAFDHQGMRKDGLT